MLERFFSTDPTIQWQPVYCPFCSQKSGPSSNCHQQTDKKDLMISHPTLGILSLYNPSCMYRKNALYQVSANYPISRPLYERLSECKGIAKIFPMDTFTVQVSLAPLFEEAQVKSEFNIIYKTFIKEMAAEEISRLPPPRIDSPAGLLLPNGATYILPSGADPNILTQISENIDGIKLIKKVGKAQNKKANPI